MQRASCWPLGVALFLCCSAAPAQETDSELFDGKWSARVQSSTGTVHTARVLIANYAGNWRDQPAKGSVVDKACRGKTFPITVQRNRQSEMQFMVWGSQISPACPDLAVDLKPIDDKTLEGTMGTGPQGQAHAQQVAAGIAQRRYAHPGQRHPEPAA